MTTKVINLDELLEEAVLAIVVKDKRHEMCSPEVGKMIKQMKMIEDLGLNPSPVNELEAGLEMVLDAFPTLTKEDVAAWTLAQVQGIVEAIRGIGGEVASTESDVKDDVEGNAPKAS